eukprot:s3931_g8.t8
MLLAWADAVEVFVMLGLDAVTQSGDLKDPESLRAQLQQLKSGSADRIMADTARRHVKEHCLKVQLVTSFHQCGGNVGDTCDIPLPAFVTSQGDIWYKDSKMPLLSVLHLPPGWQDQHGHEDKEYISLFADNVTIEGRTPLQMYSDWFNALSASFAADLGSVIEEIQVGMGPAGELRYPAYQLSQWKFCGVGAFQCYDANALKSLSSAAKSAGHADWSNPPSDAGDYNSHPVRLRQVLSEVVADALLQHGAEVLQREEVSVWQARLLGSTGGTRAITMLPSLPQATTTPTASTHMAPSLRYSRPQVQVWTSLGRWPTRSLLTVPPASGPEELVKQVMATAGHGIALGGENALPRDDTAYAKIESYKSGMQVFTYLRLGNDLLNGDNWNRFQSFVSKMPGGAKSKSAATLHGLTEAEEQQSLQTAPEVARSLQCLEGQIADLEQALQVDSPEVEVTELVEGQRLLSQLQAELLLAQAEGELLGAEAAEDHGHATSLLSLQAEAEVASLAAALSERQAEVRNLEARRAQAEDDVRIARERVATFEVWSHAAHVELRQAATEFAEEREAEAKELEEAARRCAARPLQPAAAHGGEGLDLPRTRASEAFICSFCYLWQGSQPTSLPTSWAGARTLIRKEVLVLESGNDAHTIQAAVDEDGDTVQVSRGSCPNGTELLVDFAECRNAARGLNLPFRFDGAELSGCRLQRYSNSILFNAMLDSPESSELNQPICVRRRFRRRVPQDAALPPVSARSLRHLRLFCFAWTTWKPGDLALLEDVRHSFRKCDGHRIFSDHRPTGEDDVDIVVVRVTQQPTGRSDDHWLYHRNMVGLMPAWKHMLESDVHSQYDWFLNVEFDHLLVPSLLRSTIVEYLTILRTGRKEQQRSAHGPLLLMFGNAFAFNRELVTEMGGQWTTVGRTAPAGHAAAGCPTFMEGRFEWPESCSQDIVYPNMVSVLTPPVPAYGASGCGQKPNDFPLACFEYSRQPVLDTGLDQIGLVQEVIAMRNLASEAEAETHYAGGRLAPHAKLLYTAKEVPLFHHLGDPAARRLAREILDP